MSSRRFELRYEARMAADDVGEVNVYGAVVDEKWNPDSPDVTALEFGRTLKQLDGARRLNVRINSPGGVVNEAIAMRGKLAEHPAPEKHVYVEGLCASAATLLCTIPGTRVHVLEGSKMMIHRPRSGNWGTADELESTVQMLRKTDSDMAHIYAQRMGIDDAEAMRMMDKTTWFTADEAVESGMADDVVRTSAQTPVVAMASAEEMSVMREMYGEVPEMLVVGPNVATNIEKEPAETAAEPTVREGDCARLARAIPEVLPDVASAGAERLTEPTVREGDCARLARAIPEVLPGVASAGVEHLTKPTKEEELNGEMEIKDITMEALRDGNAELYRQIMQAGAKAEQERVSEIDALTPPGYEQMAVKAKADGVDAMEYHRQIVAAQREKGANFLSARRAELEAMQHVPATAAEDERLNDENAELDAFAKEMAKLYEAERSGMNA